MGQILPVGTRVYSPDYAVKGIIIEHKDVGYGIFYLVKTDMGDEVDLDPTEVLVDRFI